MVGVMKTCANKLQMHAQEEIVLVVFYGHYGQWNRSTRAEWGAKDIYNSGTRKPLIPLSENRATVSRLLKEVGATQGGKQQEIDGSNSAQPGKYRYCLSVDCVTGMTGLPLQGVPSAIYTLVTNKRLDVNVVKLGARLLPLLSVDCTRWGRQDCRHGPGFCLKLCPKGDGVATYCVVTSTSTHIVLSFLSS